MLSTWLSQLRALLPSQQIKSKKNGIRTALSAKRRILTAEQVRKCSQEVTEQLLQCPEFKAAHNIVFYYPIHNEIDVRPIVSAVNGKTFYLPVIHRKNIEIRCYTGEDDLKQGKYGIPEPQTPTFKGKPDLIIVPGVAFDKQLQRLGRGGGYYDRFLRKYKDITKIGVCYSFQVTDQLPTDKHDISMDKLITALSK